MRETINYTNWKVEAWNEGDSYFSTTEFVSKERALKIFDEICDRFQHVEIFEFNSIKICIKEK